MSNSDTTRQSLSLNPTWSNSQSIFNELNFNTRSSLPSFTLTPNQPSARFDVRFLQETIGHHMMAVDMARLSVEKAINPDLRDLSQNIITTQNQEIETMQSWLKDWYGLSYEPEMASGDRRMLDRMANLNGADFEIDFMQEMTNHHKTMLSDAVPCVSRAGHSELSDLCQNIAKSQSSEIDQMQTWLSERYGITSDNSMMGMGISGTTDYRNSYSNDGQISNGGFENGDLTGWSTTGKAMLETSDFGSEPSEGKYYAALYGKELRVIKPKSLLLPTRVESFSSVIKFQSKLKTSPALAVNDVFIAEPSSIFPFPKDFKLPYGKFKNDSIS